MADEFDPVVLDEHGQIHVVDMFEDELILQLPTVPKHDNEEDCAGSEHLLIEPQADSSQTGNETRESTESKNGTAQAGNSSANEGAANPEEPARKNPFDVLKNLDLH